MNCGRFLTPLLLLAAVAVNAADAPLGPRRFNFETDIEPILSKFGCNTSGCHGKAEGQNGFKLSVFGSDPVADYQALLMEARGRRVFPGAPEHSLIVRKMSGAVPHGGGVRLEPGQLEYATLRDWIAAGAPFGSPDDPQVVRITIEPRERQLARGQTVPLRVTAHWSDGRNTDATPLATFQSNQESLARVDPAGVVTAGERPGTVAVMASYLGHVDLFQAFLPRPEPAAFPSLPQHNAIDRLVDERLRKLNIVPAPLASDAVFLRRVFLDLIGTLPTAAEARAFLADARPDKRSRLIDDLLRRPEFADAWTLPWADVLRVDREALGHKGAYELYRWIRDSFAANKPLDRFVRELLTAEGPLSEAPAGQFYRALPQPGDLAANVSQVFLGVRIACAQCHHHPYDRWDQVDYFGMQAFFTQVQRKTTPLGEVLTSEGSPATTHPRTNQPVFARALGEPAPEKHPDGDRRVVLAAWLTSPQNAWFARNLANRTWAHLMGRGLVEPVDDFRATNPPSHPELLDALARQLTESGFDFRSLVRFIASSRVYQQATTPNPTNADDEQSFSRARFKRLNAEVLLDAVCQTTGVPEKFEGAPAGTRAVRLWDSRVEHYFLTQFGRPLRKTVCECERQVEPSVAQVLHLLNSETVHQKVTHEAGTVARLERMHADDGALIDELYLTFVARQPNAEERANAARYFAAAAERREAAEDLAWSLLNSLEFVFNH